jgi:hypothetical protein
MTKTTDTRDKSFVTTSRINILVVEAGWVLVGEPFVGEKNIELQRAHVVRVWGTDKGIGQLALNGPTETTVLDKLGVAYVERSHLHFMIECDDKAWSKIL